MGTDIKNGVVNKDSSQMWFDSALKVLSGDIGKGKTCVFSVDTGKELVRVQLDRLK